MKNGPETETETECLCRFAAWFRCFHCLNGEYWSRGGQVHLSPSEFHS
ncbi:hypothetical protein AKJ09_04548 [Labilithrix luteola]|uniref:Uncharacterized protein n=1 Tax=Labilithrix luteola TaxID=1391654 RepID=A0A0K1PXL5_9BACT|nr:hypothetical protein AKJ09_04548 [Labilithrix luteola]